MMLGGHIQCISEEISFIELCLTFSAIIYIYWLDYFTMIIINNSVLRYDDDTPAFLALKFCIFTEGSGSGFKGRRGAPRMNLLNVFRNDLKRRKILNTLSNLDDLEILRATAINKVFWKSLSNIKYDIK